MANEWRFHKLGVEAVNDGDPDQSVRVYKLGAEVINDGDPDQVARFYKTGLEVVRDLRDQYNPAFIPSTGSVPGGFYFVSMIGWAPIGVGDDEIHAGFSFSPSTFTISDRERNPYAAHPAIQNNPEFLAEQQRILREQHNKTQGGDTTFDYGLLLKGTPNQLYTLGSLGRFYHDRFGVIFARYVQFRNCVSTETQGAPVGYFADSESISWVVTNDFTKSGRDFVLGVMCLAETPADDTYGWIVTEGPVPVGMNQQEGIIPAPETPYCWLSTGKIEVEVSGKILGRRWGVAVSPIPAAGTVYVRLEGMSPAWFSEILAAGLEEINETLVSHASRLTAAELDITNLEATSALIQQDLTTLSQRITSEEQARVRDIQSVRNLITESGTDWSSTIVAGDNVVRAEFQAADDAIRTLVAAAQYRADEAYARTGGDFAGLEAQVAALNTSVATLHGRFQNFNLNWDPPADDQILISTSVLNADGNPEWSWVGLDFIAANLPFTPAGGLSATDVQAALEELDTEKVAKVVSTDNAVVRFDGTGGDVQNSSVVINDTGQLGLGGTPTVLFHAVIATASDIFRFERSGGGSRYFTLDFGGATANFETDAITYWQANNGLFLVTTNRTDATNKSARFGVPHYTNAEEPFVFGLMTSTSTTNNLQIGGGSALGNAATQIIFYTAADNITPTGTERLRIDSTGITAALDITVPAEAYGAGWNGSNEVPTKNDTYDEIESLRTTVGTKAPSASPTLSGVVSLSGLGDYADDAAAAVGGVAVGQVYRNGSVLMIRVA